MARKQWIQGVHIKQGALHKQLHMGTQEHISYELLQHIKRSRLGAHVHGTTVTPLLKRRAGFALNVRRH